MLISRFLNRLRNMKAKKVLYEPTIKEYQKTQTGRYQQKILMTG
jgi:hypothetical protein